MATNIDPFEIHPRLVLAIGMIAVQWARVEFTLQKLVIGLLQADASAGLMMTTNLGNRTLSEFLKTAASAADPEFFSPAFVPTLSALNKEFDRLLGLRNRIVHGIWLQNSSEDDAMTLVVRFKGNVRMYEEVWPIEDIEGIVDAIVDLLDAITRFGQDHNLFAPMERWEQRASSRSKPQAPKPAEYQNRDPKTTEVLNQLRSSRA